MRWKTKPTPGLGKTRWVKKFAWCPVETDSGDNLWMESYYVKQELGWHYNWCHERVIGWFDKNTVTPEEYDKLSLEEDFLTAVSTSGDFTLAKAVESYEGVIRYDLTPEQKDSLKCNATYIPGAEGYQDGFGTRK